jgi:hypothetical protein
MKSLYALCAAIFSLLIFSCKKTGFINSPNAVIGFSADTLKFDTVFVTAGSVYQSFKIMNNNDKKLRLSSVRLAGGSTSAFKVNVDGTSGSSFTDVDINANDSIYVFVQVNINPSAANLPFVIRDSILFNYNGNSHYIQLEAWGKNAHFFRNRIIAANETWNNDLPYVILGSLTVNANQTLTINNGCRVYLHADAPFLVNGTLQVNGQKDSANRVYFRGDRLDDPYKDYPAAWPGIYFYTSSKNNLLNYAVIKNAYQAIALQDPATNANPKLTLNQCIIDNAYDAGILSLNSSLRAVNCLVSNCGKNIFLAEGGNYQFIHCTAASYSNYFIEHKNPVLLLSNYITVNNSPLVADLNAQFTNCIFWGDGGLVTDEVLTARNTGATFNVIVNNALWKVQSAPANITASQVISNQSPGFDSIDISHHYYDFHLLSGSPAIDKGVNAGITIDLDGKLRLVGTLPDLGAYEKQ